MKNVTMQGVANVAALSDQMHKFEQQQQQKSLHHAHAKLSAIEEKIRGVESKLKEMNPDVTSDLFWVYCELMEARGAVTGLKYHIDTMTPPDRD